VYTRLRNSPPGPVSMLG